jgi:hypothetical protein
MQIINIELEESIDTKIRFVYRDDTTNLPVDVTGYKAILQIRPQFGSPLVVDELNTETATIVLGGVSGTIDLIFTPNDTDQNIVIWGWTRAAYDLVIVNTTGTRIKLAKGFITIARSASLGSPN